MFFKQDRVGTEVNKLLSCDDSFDDLTDFLMDEGFSTGNGHDRCAALVNGSEAFLRREPLVQDFLGILYLSASGTLKVAPEKRFKHQYERELSASAQFLAKNI